VESALPDRLTGARLAGHLGKKEAVLITKCFYGWVGELKEKRNSRKARADTFVMMNARHKMGGLFRAWRAEVQTHRRRVVQLHRYFLSRLIAVRERCFFGWLGGVRHARKLRKSLASFAFRGAHGLKRLAYDTWRSEVLDKAANLKRGEKAFARISARWMGANARMVFSEWRTLVGRKRRVKDRVAAWRRGRTKSFVSPGVRDVWGAFKLLTRLKGTQRNKIMKAFRARTDRSVRETFVGWRALLDSKHAGYAKAMKIFAAKAGLLGAHCIIEWRAVVAKRRQHRAKLMRAMRKIERKRLVDSLTLWHTKAYTRARIRRSLQGMYLRSAKGLLRGTWDAWRSACGAARTAKHRQRKAALMWYHAAMSRSLQAWLGGVRERKRHMLIVQRVLGKVLHAAMSAAFDAWRHHVHNVAKKLKFWQQWGMRVTSGLLRAVVSEWRRAVSHKKDRRTILKKAAARLFFRALAGAFHAWRDKTADTKSKMRAARKVAAKFLNAKLYAAYEAWRECVATRRTQRALLKRAAGKFANRALAAAFGTWADSAAQGKAHKVLLKRCAARIMNRQLSGAWDAWAHLVAERRRVRKALTKAGGMMANAALRLQNAAFASWYDATLGMKEQTVKVARCLGRCVVVAAARAPARSLRSLRCRALARQPPPAAGRRAPPAPAMAPPKKYPKSLRARAYPRSVARQYAEVNIAAPKHYWDDALHIAWGDLDQYEVSRPLGKGKYGEVFEGFNFRVQRRCVVKIMRPVKEQRLRREIKILNHVAGGPNIIRLLDVVRDPDTKTPCFVFDYVEAVGLRELQAVLTADDVRLYTYQLLAALDHTHARGIMHRDIKPANVLIDHAARQLTLSALCRRRRCRRPAPRPLRGLCRGAVRAQLHFNKQR